MKNNNKFFAIIILAVSALSIVASDKNKCKSSNPVIAVTDDGQGAELRIRKDQTCEIWRNGQHVRSFNIQDEQKKSRDTEPRAERHSWQ